MRLKWGSMPLRIQIRSLLTHNVKKHEGIELVYNATTPITKSKFAWVFLANNCNVENMFSFQSQYRNSMTIPRAYTIILLL